MSVAGVAYVVRGGKRLVPALLGSMAAVSAACSGHGPPSAVEEKVERSAEALQQGVGPGANEPSLAINPLNPYNIAISYGTAFSATNDWGTTFNNYSFVQPNQNQVNAGDIVLTYDSAGLLYGEHPSLPQGGSLGDIIINQVNPANGMALNTWNATASLQASNHDYDKPWLVADHYAGSPFRDRLYMAWSESAVQHAAYSSDHGQTWHFVRVGDMPAGQTPGQLSLPSEAPTAGATITVAPNGDVYMAYHAQNGGLGADGEPNGTSGDVVLLRSTNGGADFNQRSLPYVPGSSDIPFNDPPDNVRPIPHNDNLTAGSSQPYVMADPLTAGLVYVVAADDRNNGGTANIDVYMVRSTDYGQHFTSPLEVDQGAGATSFYPTAAIDDRTGCLAVMWWDNRAAVASQVNANDYDLDVYVRGTLDHGVTWSPEIKLNNAIFDPDLAAPQRRPGEYRIGEYNGLAVVNGVAYGAWTGNGPGGQLIQYASARACQVNNEPPSQANIAAAQQDANVTTVLTVGNDGAIWDRWVNQQGAWQGPTAQTSTGLVAAGAQIITAPNGSSELDAFFVDTKGQLREMTEKNDGAWTLVSTPLTAAGSLVSGARLAYGTVSGNIRLVAYVDKTGALGGAFQVSGGAWQTGTLTGANFALSGAQPAIGNQDSNQLDVFVFTPNGTLEVMWYNGAWFGPAALSTSGIGPGYTNVVTAMQGPSQLDVLFVGTNGALQAAWVTKSGGAWGPWNAPINLTSTQYAPPGSGVSALAWSSTSTLYAFFVNNSGAVAASSVSWSPPQAWQAPVALSPNDYASPGDGIAAAPQYGGQLDVFTAGKAGVLATWMTSQGWSVTIPLP